MLYFTAKCEMVSPDCNLWLITDCELLFDVVDFEELVLLLEAEVDVDFDVLLVDFELEDVGFDVELVDLLVVDVDDFDVVLVDGFDDVLDDVVVVAVVVVVTLSVLKSCSYFEKVSKYLRLRRK